MIRRGITIAALLIVASASTTGCRGEEQKVRIGHKAFIEQEILARVAWHLVTDTGAQAELVACGDTFGCQQKLRRGELDLMFEYTGTGLYYSGAIAQGGADIDAVRELYKPLGLTWLDPVGFDNGYVLVMNRSRATELGIETIADLGEHPRKLRFAIPRTYLGRPSDGYASLVERHGIVPRGEPLLEQKPTPRLEAVLGNRADVAVAYRTDGELMGLDLVELQDSLGFFPPYEAAVVVRQKFAEDNPAIVEALGILDGQIDAATMRAMNYRAGVEGVSTAAVADRLLSQVGAAPAVADPDAPSLRLAVAASDKLGRETEMALRTLRQSFPGRHLQLMQVKDPAAALTEGKTRLALLGAERFFSSRGDALTRREDIEAIAVTSQRLVHVLRRAGDDASALAGRIGVNPQGSGSAKVGSEILAAQGGSAAAYATTPELMDAVAAGELDGAIVLATTGDAQISQAVKRGTVDLASLSDPSLRSRLPHLQPARIPPNSYAGQVEPIETLHSQVVIAGPAPRGRRGIKGGPSASVKGAAQPLTLSEARTLVAASEVRQIPDAVIPSIWSRVNETQTPDDDELVPPALDTMFNVAVFIFIGWLVILTFRRDEET